MAECHRIVIDIDLSNADPDVSGALDFAAELLRAAALKMSHQDFPSVILDPNGNTCGRITYFDHDGTAI